jgi:hypothetical protein
MPYPELAMLAMIVAAVGVFGATLKWLSAPRRSRSRYRENRPGVTGRADTRGGLNNNVDGVP